MATLIRTDGTERSATPADAARGFTLEECYKLIGCTMIEALTLPDGKVLILDEEGKYRAAPVHNERATTLARGAGISFWDYVVGDVLICSPEEFQ